MKPAPIAHFHSATSAADASQRVLAATDTAVVIAGGQSLIPMLALRVAPADTLVHVGKIAELRAVTPIAGGVRIGAGVTHAEIEDGKVGGGAGGFLKRVAAGIAYRAVRNHGTIGGSLGLADPAADWPAALLALDARIHIKTASGERVEDLDTFLRGAYTTTLEPGEILMSFDVPDPGSAAKFGYAKVSRKSGAFAMSIGCAIRKPGQGMRVVAGGLQQRARRLPETEKVADRSGLADEEALRAAIAEDLANVQAGTDAYEARLHTATMLRALRETA